MLRVARRSDNTLSIFTAASRLADDMSNLVREICIFLNNNNYTLQNENYIQNEYYFSEVII